MKQILRRGFRGLRGLASPAAFVSRSDSSHSFRATLRQRNRAAVEPLESRRLLSAASLPGAPSIHPADANGNPPRVSISAPDVTSATQATEAVTVTFIDNSGIDPTSITTDNITVVNQTTGVKLDVTAAALNPTDGSGSTDVATYTVAAPDTGGNFTSDDNGTYSVILGLNQVYDPTGSAAQQTAGSFTINIPPAGATPPVAAILPPAPVTTAAASVNVSVTYIVTAGVTDQINAATINPKNIVVSGPNGALNVSAVTVSPSGGNATSLTATYTIAAPNGAFTTANNGAHTVTLNPSQPVLDTNGVAAVAKPASAVFQIYVPSALAIAISPPLTVGTAQPSVAIAVTYTDPAGVNLSTIAPSNLLVTREGVANPTPLAVTGVLLNPATGTPTQVTATYTVAAPSGAFSLENSGTYDIMVQANQVQDANGVYAVPALGSFFVNVPGASSLSPSLSRAKLPAAAPSGTRLGLSVPVTVTNTGTIASSGTSQVALYLSPTPDLSNPSAATPIASSRLRLVVKAHKSRAVNLKVASLPASVAAGAYYVVAAVTDAGGNTAVTASASAVSVSPPFVNLTGSLAAPPSLLRIGRKASLGLTVSNAGNVPAAGSLQIQLLARPAGTTGAADVTLATPTLRLKLAAGASRRLRLPVALPQTLSAGATYTLVAVLDPANLFNDSNRADNTVVGSYLFTAE